MPSIRVWCRWKWEVQVLRRWKCERTGVIVGARQGSRASMALVWGYRAHQSCGSGSVARRSLGCCVTLLE